MNAGGTLSTAVGALGPFGNVLPALAEPFPGAADQAHRAG
jgi:hypothetical protein